MKNVSDKIVETIETHILVTIKFCFSKIVPFEIMWKNTVYADRPQVTIWRMPDI